MSQGFVPIVIYLYFFGFLQCLFQVAKVVSVEKSLHGNGIGVKSKLFATAQMVLQA
ncbi:hypothetical protein EVA_05582 [gut metagenome]|uniref:Uncharacterized protein n=1 Tax=gut metagenome TaxID=749906 RepID=J9GZE7_9ZZZZ